MNKDTIATILRHKPRLEPFTEMRPGNIVEAVLEQHPDYDDQKQQEMLAILQRAVAVASSAHEGVLRKSGEPYIIHPYNVAYFIAKEGMDIDAVVAGLLHDTVEDTSTTLAEIEEMFGPKVAHLVDGVTKLQNIKLRDKKQAYAFQKLLTFAADDLRVLFIKLFDRLHNLYTIDAMSKSSRKRICEETLRFYAPLAQRLGLYWLKNDLEAIAFYYAYPDDWHDVDRFLADFFGDTDAVLDVLMSEVKAAIDSQKRLGFLPKQLNFRLSQRVKSYYSIYRKRERLQRSYASLRDLLAVRVVLDTPNNGFCYVVMGALHSHPGFITLSEHFEDYISRPKQNFYRSLHTILRHKKYFFEAQIRTEEMDAEAEGGNAAHWLYKDRMSGDNEVVLWLRNQLKHLDESEDPIRFVSDIEKSLPIDKIAIFTPAGNLVSLPENATLLDFAYAIHGDIGNQCVGGIVNGNKRPLNYLLQNRDEVRVDTERTQHPHADWLKFVVTTKAKNNIRRYLKKQNKDLLISEGRALMRSLFSALNKGNLCDKFENTPVFSVIKKRFSLPGNATLDSLCYQVATGEIKLRKLISLLFTEEEIQLLVKAFPQRVGKVFPDLLPQKRVKKESVDEAKPPIYINGVGVLKEYGLAKCCSPTRGDAVVAYISPTRGYVIHKQHCASLKRLNPQRIERYVYWYNAILYSVDLRIELEDRVGAVQEVISEITAENFNIASMHLNPISESVQRGTLYITVKSTDLEAVQQLGKRLKKLHVFSFQIEHIRQQ